MQRKALVVTHGGRPDAIAARVEVGNQLQQAGFEITDYEDALGSFLSTDVLKAAGDPIFQAHEDQYRALAAEAEIVIVLGGDGTILRAAELVHGSQTPILGINLGHVGFLTGSERGDLPAAISQVVHRQYTIDQRNTIEVRITPAPGQPEVTGWALNEATLEKANRERMVEVVIGIDGRPVSSFGCDGVVMSTATGSTAHAFSAGGPIIWPDVAGTVIVPLSAHALFARPMVIGPQSTAVVELLERTRTQGVVTMDGRRRIDLQPGGRITVTSSPTKIRLVRLGSAPFTDRLVRKFELPVNGWRGPAVLGPQEDADAG